MNLKRLLATIAAASMLAISVSQAHASLIGHSMNGSILPGSGGGTVGTQFTSPALVGAGVEFTGNWLFAPFGQNWLIQVDVGATGFTVSANEITTAPNNISDGPTMVGISLTDLTANFDTANFLSGPAGVSSIAVAGNTVTVFWNQFPFGGGDNPPTGGTWTFGLTSVPEPATLALLGLGLAGLGFSRRKQ